MSQITERAVGVGDSSALNAFTIKNSDGTTVISYDNIYAVYTLGTDPIHSDRQLTIELSADAGAPAIPNGASIVLISGEEQITLYLVEDQTKEDPVSVDLSSYSLLSSVTISCNGKTSPSVQVEGGLSLSTRTIKMTCPTEGSTIRYTVNGDDVTASSTEYSDPIEVRYPVTIKAKAFKADLLDSDLSSISIES